MTINKQATATTTVSHSNTAKAVKSGSLDVFSTPMMIALMEEAAFKALASDLPDGQTSVGTQINAEHLSASPIGATVTAKATINAVEKRKITFDITVHDNTKEIGRGTHTRFIVDTERFMANLT